MNITFRQKLFLPLLLSWICLLAVSVNDALHTRALRFDERKTQLANTADMAISLAREYGALAADGTLSADDAQQQALARIKALRFGASGSIVVFDKDRMLMHPLKAALAGAPLQNVLDTNGQAICVEAIKAAARTGAGFTTHMWAKPGAQQPVPKISYVAAYRPWGWYFMVGLYADDLDQDCHRQLGEAALWLALIGAVLTGLVVALVRSIEHEIGDSAAKAGQGARLVQDAGATMQEIVDSVGRVSHMIGAISLATQEQGMGIEQINLTVTQMDQATQQNAALVEEAAAASSAMREQAGQLAQVVRVFRLAVTRPVGAY